jgi:SAM-dependent methyltransferase
METLEDVFERLGDGTTEHDIYTTLAPLYRVMYVARGRIEGQLAAVEAAAPPGASTVLEVGCGTGHLLGELETAFDRAVGVDPSPAMARLAAEQCRYVCRGDARAFRPESVDVAILLGAVLGHIRPDTAGRATLSHVHRTLRPGGRVVCSVHRRLDEPRSRRLTRSVDGYTITQRDEQRPSDDGTFEWAVRFELTDETTGETRRVATSTRIRAFGTEELERWFREAGFVDINSRPRRYVSGPGEEDRAFVLVGEVPAN